MKLKKIKIAGLLLPLVLMSCNSKAKSGEQNTGTDIEYPSEINAFISKFGNEKTDFTTDKSFLEDTLQNTTKRLLSLDQVKALAKNLSKDEHTEVNTYYIQDYYKIEQKKVNSQYDEFLKTLDLGMMQDVNCYSVGKINYGDSVSVLLWKVVYSSYPACPFYQGTNILASVISDKKVVQTIQVSCSESAADAPSSFSTLQKMRLDKSGNLVCDSESITMDMETQTEHINDLISYKLTKKGFIKK